MATLGNREKTAGARECGVRAERDLAGPGGTGRQAERGGAQGCAGERGDAQRCPWAHTERPLLRNKAPSPEHHDISPECPRPRTRARPGAVGPVMECAPFWETRVKYVLSKIRFTVQTPYFSLPGKLRKINTLPQKSHTADKRTLAAHTDATNT